MHAGPAPRNETKRAPSLSLSSESAVPSILDRVQLAAQELVHGEHVDLVLLEDGMQLFVAEDLALVARVLELVALDVVPEFFDHLGAGELRGY